MKLPDILLHFFVCGWCDARVTVQASTFRAAYMNLRTIDRWIDCGSRYLCPRCAADMHDALRDAVHAGPVEPIDRGLSFATGEGTVAFRVAPQREVMLGRAALQVLGRGRWCSLNREQCANLIELARFALETGRNGPK